MRIIKRDPAFIALIVMSLATPAAAQPLEVLLPLAVCKRMVPDDAARLKCYDAIVDDLVAKPRASPEPAGWQVKESKSPVDDRAQISGTLAAVDGKAVLMVRCHDGVTEVAIVSDSYIGSGKPVRIVLRVNAAPAITETWNPSSNGRGAFAPYAIKALKALPDSATLFVRLHDATGSRHDATFQLGGIGPLREKIAKVCQWD